MDRDFVETIAPSDIDKLRKLAREKRMQHVAAVVEQIIIRGGPELNPLMIATAAIMAWEKSNEYSSDNNKVDTGNK